VFKSILASELPLSVEGPFLKLYLKLPVDNVPTSISVLSRLVKIEPLETADWIDYAIRNLLEKDPVLVGSWLTDVDASEAVIGTLSAKLPAISPDECLILVNAYLSEEDAAQAQATLDATKGLLDPVVEAYLLSQILLLNGDREGAIVYWDEAHQGLLGSNRFPMMKNLGILALKLDQPVNGMQSLYTALTAGIPFSQQLAGQLIELTLKYGSLRQSTQVAEYLANTYSDSVIHKNNLAYFKFLAEEQVEENVEVMRELVDGYPDVPQFRLTLALGLVKAGRTNEANRLLKSTDINWDTTSTRGLLIYAVVLAASDQRTLSEGLVQNIDMDELIPEEKALLEAF
jgi:tetratricopeptide (TPR) repeat protein